MKAQLLYIDSWPSRKLEILCTGRTRENMLKQSRGWLEMYGCYEICWCPRKMRAVYECESWISLSLPSRERQRVDGRPAEAESHRVAQSGPPIEYPWPRSRRSAKLSLEDNTVWYGQNKLWGNVIVFIRLPPSVCLTHTLTPPMDPLENQVWELYIHNQVL